MGPIVVILGMLAILHILILILGDILNSAAQTQSERRDARLLKPVREAAAEWTRHAMRIKDLERELDDALRKDPGFDKLHRFLNPRKDDDSLICYTDTALEKAKEQIRYSERREVIMKDFEAARCNWDRIFFENVTTKRPAPKLSHEEHSGLDLKLSYLVNDGMLNRLRHGRYLTYACDPEIEEWLKLYTEQRLKAQS